tara:strand:+ start:9911 stop:10849 length:939 start_codon:yes stop_codon:yes gene_type:complete
MKNTRIILISIILFGAIYLNFLLPEVDENKITISNHQNEFNKYFKSFSLVTPDSIIFANELAPINSNDIWERYDKEIHKNVYWQSNTIFYLKRANKYFPIIEPILKKNNIPNDFKYLAVIESGLENLVSPAGASGYWQFMKGTAIDYGLEVNSEIDERYHLEKSTQAACEYLQKAYDRFGSWTMAAAAYNMGKGGLERKVKQQGSKNYYNLYLNMETSRYIFRLLAIKEIFENKEKYGFNLREQDLYSFPETRLININEEDINLFELANNLQINYKILKIFNPWLRDTEITNKNNKTYIIKIPTEKDINIFE